MEFLSPELGESNRIYKNFNVLLGASILREIPFNLFERKHKAELIGNLFEQSLRIEERKERGQYYTPKTIVEYMISQLDITEKSTILDPSCGCGSFLLTLYDAFKNKFGEKFINNIYGVDLNEKAVKITRACLYMQAEFNDGYLDVVRKNIKLGNTLVLNKKFDRLAFDWNKEFKHIKEQGGFDFVIGNPPYVTLSKSKDFDAAESIYSEIINTPVNAATLMIGKALEVLKPNGVLAFLLPKSILFVDSYTNLRDYLAKNTEVQQIFDLGLKFKDVRGEQIILIVKKKAQKGRTGTKIYIYSDKNKELREQPQVEISQRDLSETNKFLTFEHKSLYTLINKIADIGIQLNDFVDGEICRGLPVGGNYLTKESKEGLEILRGKSIKKFFLKEPLYLSRKILERQSVAKIEKIKNKKIVLQNIFSSEAGVIAAYDDKGILTVDTVTNIIVGEKDKAKYILALLNSKLVNFYLMYGVFNRSRLTMHLDKSYIGLIPIVTSVTKAELKPLIRIVDTINGMQEPDQDFIKRKSREIDFLIYAFYKLKQSEINLVEKATATMLSERSKW